MKYILTLLIVLFFNNCIEYKKTNQDEFQKQAINNKKSVETDTVLSNEEQATVTDWLEITKNAKNKEMNRYGNHYEIESYTVLKDSLSYAVFMISSGTCLRQELETYWNRKKRDQIEIEESCDHDLSIPKHSWKEFEFVTPTRISIKEYSETVPDSLIAEDGYLKEGYDFIEAKTKMDTIIKTFEISYDGAIIEIK